MDARDRNAISRFVDVVQRHAARGEERSAESVLTEFYDSKAFTDAIRALEAGGRKYLAGGEPELTVVESALRFVTALLGHTSQEKEAWRLLDSLRRKLEEWQTKRTTSASHDAVVGPPASPPPPSPDAPPPPLANELVTAARPKPHSVVAFVFGLILASGLASGGWWIHSHRRAPGAGIAPSHRLSEIGPFPKNIDAIIKVINAAKNDYSAAGVLVKPAVSAPRRGQLVIAMDVAGYGGISQTNHFARILDALRDLGAQCGGPCIRVLLPTRSLRHEVRRRQIQHSSTLRDAFPSVCGTRMPGADCGELARELDWTGREKENVQRAFTELEDRDHEALCATSKGVSCCELDYDLPYFIWGTETRAVFAFPHGIDEDTSLSMEVVDPELRRRLMEWYEKVYKRCPSGPAQ
jgi:hypothetical protein